MKKILLLLFLIGFLFSGNSQNPLDSYYADIEKPFSSISDNYTLMLEAKLDDCGEFGGHLETIELKRIDGIMVAEVSIYKKNCDGQWRLSEEKILNSKTYKVSRDQLLMFENYLAQLMNLSLKDEMPHHAGSHFSADLQYRGQTEYKRQRISLKYHDVDNKWSEFEELKKELEK